MCVCQIVTPRLSKCYVSASSVILMNECKFKHSTPTVLSYTGLKWYHITIWLPCFTYSLRWIWTASLENVPNLILEQYDTNFRIHTSSGIYSKMVVLERKKMPRLMFYYFLSTLKYILLHTILNTHKLRYLYADWLLCWL